MTTAALPAVQKLDPIKLSDEMLGSYLVAVGNSIEDLRSVEHGIKLEIERRLNERDARALAHPQFEKIELEEQFTPYVADTTALNDAAILLREAGHDDEAAKVIKYVRERVDIIPAHYEHGNPRSIHAIIDKYGGAIGECLKRGLTRTSLGTKLVIKRRTS